MMKVKLIDNTHKKLDFEISQDSEYANSIVRFKIEDGEWVYQPRKHTIFGTRLFEEEVEAILKKLKELNSQRRIN